MLEVVGAGGGGWGMKGGWKSEVKGKVWNFVNKNGGIRIREKRKKRKRTEKIIKHLSEAEVCNCKTK